MWNHGNYVASLSELGRWLAERAEELGCDDRPRDRRDAPARERRARGRRPHGGQGRRPGRRAPPELRAGLGASRARDDPRRGHAGPPDRRRARPVRAHVAPAGLGARRQGGLGGRAPARPRRPHDGVAAARVLAAPRVRRELPLPARRPHRLARARGRPRLRPTRPSPCTTCSRSSRATRASGGSSRAGSGSPGARRRSPRAASSAFPDRFNFPGGMIVGDGAGFVNVPSLKGIHYAVRSGTLAAETALEAVAPGRTAWTPGALDGYDEAVKASYIWSDLDRVRNMRPAFKHGFVRGAMLAGAALNTLGRFPRGDLDLQPDASSYLVLGDRSQSYPAPDGKLFFDKLSSVYLSGNQTRDDAPNHIRVRREVPRVVAEAWVHMCPRAGVRDRGGRARRPRGGSRHGRRHRLELRPVRRHHRQGRPAHAARGRLGPRIRPDVTSCTGHAGRRRPRLGHARQPSPPDAAPQLGDALAPLRRSRLPEGGALPADRLVQAARDAGADRVAHARGAPARGDHDLGRERGRGGRLRRGARGARLPRRHGAGRERAEGRGDAGLRRDRRPRGRGAGGGLRAGRGAPRVERPRVRPPLRRRRT